MCRLRNIALESVTQKCDRRTDRRTDRWRIKWSLCVAMLRRRHKNDGTMWKVLSQGHSMNYISLTALVTLLFQIRQPNGQNDIKQPRNKVIPESLADDNNKFLTLDVSMTTSLWLLPPFRVSFSTLYRCKDALSSPTTIVSENKVYHTVWSK